MHTFSPVKVLLSERPALKKRFFGGYQRVTGAAN
jgi:hypothetical protein